MASNHTRNFWSLVNIIESESQLLIEPLKTGVQNLPLNLCFLDAILKVTGKMYIQDNNLQALLDRANSVLNNKRMEYTQLCSDFSRIESIGSWTLPINMHDQLLRILKGLELLVPDVQEIYTILSKSASRTKVEMTDEHVMMKYLDFILQNLEDLLTCKADSIAPVKEEVKSVQKSFRFLRDFLGFTAKRCSKLQKLKDLMILAEVVVENISCLLYLYLVKSKMDDQWLSQMKLELSEQSQKFNLVKSDVRNIFLQALKALKSEGNPTPLDDEFALGFLKSLQDNLLELSLSDNRPNFMTSIRDLLIEVHQELRFLKDFTIDLPWIKYSSKVDQKFNDLWEHSDALIKEAGCVIYTLYDHEKNERMALKLNSAASDLLADIKVTKKDARNIYHQLVPKSLRTNFPRTDKLGSISFIFQNLNDVIVSQADSVARLKCHVEAVLKDLQLLREDFTGIAKQQIKRQELEYQLTRFKDIVYHTEFVVDLMLCKSSPFWFTKLGLFDVIEETKMIKIELKQIKNTMSDANSGHGVSCCPVEVSSGTSSKDDQELMSNGKMPISEFVIFSERAEKIRGQIEKGSEKLEILSIVGMPGIGKTTLADSVFQHFSMTNCFHILARCTVTRVYSIERLFLEILKQITEEAEQWHDLNEGDLGEKLYQRLRGRKYLIFRDDIWNFRPLKDMRASLPDDKNGSRILLTSRFDNIASEADCMSTTYHLSPLSDEKTWKLLQVKVFGKKSCPKELAKIGKEMATVCRGLPLLVDVIAGILRAAERRRDVWQQVAESFKSQSVDDLQGRCRKVIEHSYYDLPDHLKACFLYFAAFPKGREISTSKLTSMWIAEGFVQQVLTDDPRSFEAAARTYLDDLISRSLITISKTGRLGKAISCRVHDLLHDFALAKAHEDHFLLQIQKYSTDLPTSSINNYLRCDEEYRLCFYTDEACSSYTRVYGPRVRTVLGHGLHFSCVDLGLEFKLLRVLDLPKSSVKYFQEMSPLIHLRFLALYFLEESYFKGLKQFQKLETFLVHKAFKDEKNGVLLLEHICGMKKLMHFRLYQSHIWQYRNKKVFDKLQLQNLVSLSYPKLCYGKLSEELMERMPNLRKLACRVLDSWDSARNCNMFPKLELLRKLESLKLVYIGSLGNGSYSWKFSFPQYLKKVALRFFCRPWSEISVLGKLKYLEVLRLGSRAFEGKTWNMRVGEFPKLRYLSLLDLDIEEWMVSEDDLPCLEKLVVASCPGVNDLPSCLADRATLKEIYLFECRKSVGLSAQRMMEDQVDNGNENFVLSIRHPI